METTTLINQATKLKAKYFFFEIEHVNDIDTINIKYAKTYRKDGTPTKLYNMPIVYEEFRKGFDNNKKIYYVEIDFFNVCDKTMEKVRRYNIYIDYNANFVKLRYMSASNVLIQDLKQQ